MHFSFVFSPPVFLPSFCPSVLLSFLPSILMSFLPFFLSFLCLSSVPWYSCRTPLTEQTLPGTRHSVPPAGMKDDGGPRTHTMSAFWTHRHLFSNAIIQSKFYSRILMPRDNYGGNGQWRWWANNHTFQFYILHSDLEKQFSFGNIYFIGNKSGSMKMKAYL